MESIWVFFSQAQIISKPKTLKDWIKIRMIGSHRFDAPNVCDVHNIPLKQNNVRGIFESSNGKNLQTQRIHVWYIYLHLP